MQTTTLENCIRFLRTDNGMTQAQLADKLGVTDKAVSKWERGLSYPDIELIPRLCEILGVTVDDLLGECAEDCRPAMLREAFELSRDIRTPLHIILGYVDIAKRSYEDPEVLMKYLDGIRFCGEYMMTMLSDRNTDPHAGPDSGYTEEIEQFLKERQAAGSHDLKAYDFSGCQILVAEDMAINREIAAEVLKQTGAITHFAVNGAECVQKVTDAKAGTYDLILMDIRMPVMDGFEATRRIRALADPEKASIPIVAMTSNVSEQDRDQAFEAGMNAFAEKPIFVDRLFATIKEYLV